MNNIFKTLRKNIFRISTFILFLIAAYLAFNNIQLQQQVNSLDDRVKNLSNEVSSKNQELKLSYSNRAGVKEEVKKNYSPQEFMISSPLFEKQEMIIKKLSYRGSEIIEMSIDIPQSNEQPHKINIKVWNYINIPNQNIAKFDDYYNALPLQESAFTDNKPNYYKYVTAKGFRMNRSCGELSVSKNISSIHSIYVIISGYQCIGVLPDQTENTIRQSTKYLEKVADTISF